MELNNTELTIIYLALSTQALDCHEVLENQSPESKEYKEAYVILENTLPILDKVYLALKGEENQTIQRPQWKQ